MGSILFEHIIAFFRVGFWRPLWSFRLRAFPTVIVLRILKAKSFLFLWRIHWFFMKLLFLPIELCYSSLFITQIKETFKQFIKPLLIKHFRINYLIFELFTNVILWDIEFKWHLILFLKHFFPLYWLEPFQPSDFIKTFQSAMHVTLD